MHAALVDSITNWAISGCETDSAAFRLEAQIENNQNTSIEGVKIYPNPNSGEMKVEWNFAYSKSFKVVVDDIVGRQIFNITENTPTGNQIISLNVGPGLYMLRAFSDESLKATEQIIIIK